MKNCIVLSGQYRTFDQTWENIKRFIDLNQLDVYCHLWSDSQEEFNNVIDRLNPVRIKLENYETHREEFEMMERRIRTMNPKNPNQDRIAGNASMNYSRKKAFDLIDEEYDTLVYCRYDIKFDQLFDFKGVDMLITPFEESYNLISDIFAIMPFSYAKHYFLYDVYERLHMSPFEKEFEDYLRYERKYGEENIRIHKEDRYCPHMMLLRNIYMNKLRGVTTDQLRVSIQR
jgi:hypothetical protein